MFSTILTYFKRTLRILFAVAVGILILRSFIVDPGRVNGKSMEHTFLDSDFFLVDRITLLLREPARGDVVQFIDPNSAKPKLVIKRVIGLPGERVKISSDVVSIIQKDGTSFTLTEPYLDAGTTTKTPTKNTEITTVIPQNTYFMLGDNRDESTDSRYYGAVQRSYITGRVIQIVRH